MAKLLQSFRFALEGLKYTVATQRNMRIHFIVSLFVLILSLSLSLSKIEILILLLTMTLVLFAELLNTAVEKIIDLITEEYHPLAKIVKDVSAGAVLLTAGLAVIVGVSIFYPHMHLSSLNFGGNPLYPPRGGLAAVIVFNFVLTLLLKGWWHRSGKTQWEPSMTMSMTFCVLILIVSIIGNGMVAWLVCLLTGMLVIMRYRIDRNRIAIFLGSLLGVVVSMIGIQIL